MAKIKILCTVFVVLIINVLIFTGFYIYFKIKNKKSEKVSGGYGTVEPIYGSIVKLDQNSKLNPITITGEITINYNNISNDLITLTNIGKNPLYVFGYDHNSNFYNYLTHKENNWYYNFYTNTNLLNLEDIIKQILVDDSYINDEEYENIVNEYNELISSLISVYNENIMIIKSGISQGNMKNYIYLDPLNQSQLFRYPQYLNGILNINEHISKLFKNDKVFRNWYDTNKWKNENVINIYPEKFLISKNNRIELQEINYSRENITPYKNSDYGAILNNKIDKIYSYTKQNGKPESYGIADIYPAKMNMQVALLICAYCNKNNIAPEIKYKLVALHVLMIYLINIYGHFAHYSPYNASIKDNFYVE